jgi:hypothetical protein
VRGRAALSRPAEKRLADTLKVEGYTKHRKDREKKTGVAEREIYGLRDLLCRYTAGVFANVADWTKVP